MLRVTEKHLLIKIPLNYGCDIDRVLFFHGLEWFGAVASDLTSYQPVLTRQPFYYYPDLQKAFYLFVPLVAADNKNVSTLRSEIFCIVDNYLFAYNCRHPGCRANARGKGINLEPDDHKKCINCDGGRVWVHDPFRYAFDDKPKGYIHQKTDEECTSGRCLIDQEWKLFESKLRNLVNSYIAVKSVHPPNTDHFKKSDFTSIDELKSSIHNFSALAEKMGGEGYEYLSNYIAIYNPIKFEGSRFFPLEPLLTLEWDVISSMLPYKVEKSNTIDDFFTDQNCKQLLEMMHYYEENIPFEIVHVNNLYDPWRLGYFFSGLNGDRPFSQFLNFYNLLEAEFGDGSESLNLKTLIEDQNRFPNSIFKNAFNEASKTGETSITIKGNGDERDRVLISKTIYYRIRNRIVHAKRTEKYKEKDESPIKPFTDDELNQQLDFWVVFVRELTRHLICSNPSKIMIKG